MTIATGELIILKPISCVGCKDKEECTREDCKGNNEDFGNACAGCRIGCGPARTWRDSTFLAHQSLPVTYKQPLLISMKTDLERIR